jgi:hypothetical protein
VNGPWRRLAAVAAAMTLVALVACDLWIGSVRSWWDRHSLTASVVANLLVLAVAALIVDEVVARRQRRERSVSVAVQALIVYGQARRTYGAITATDEQELRSANAPDELRTLANMLLTASPSLFDDPLARKFMEEVDRFSVLMFRLLSSSSGKALSEDRREQLTSEVSRLQATVEPLLARIPMKDRSLLEGVPQR